MEARIEIKKDVDGFEGLLFLDGNNRELYWIPFYHLRAVTADYCTIDDLKFGAVLTQVVRVAKFEWVTTSILTKLASIIQERFPQVDENLFCDTFLAVSRVRRISDEASKFEMKNPI